MIDPRKLRRARFRLGLTPQQAVQAAGDVCTYQYLNALERGQYRNPSAPILKALADAYGVAVDDLLEDGPVEVAQ